MNALRTFFSQKLATQLLALLMLALLVAFTISMLITLGAQQLNDRNVRDRFAVERVHELTIALEVLSARNRQQFTKAAESRTTSIRVGPRPAVMDSAKNERSRGLAREIMDALGRDDVRASVLSRRESTANDDTRNAGRNREVIAISVPLKTGDWLNFNSREARNWYTQKERQFMFLVFGISMFTVSGFGWFFVIKLTRPIEAIAAAARKSANGDRSARIPVDGPAEFREAANAFNSMQTQIELFESERVRTIAAVGHDLRTPLTSLRVRAEMIDRQDLREPMIRTLEEVSAMADGLVTYAQHRHEEAFVERLDLHTIVSRFASENDIPFECQIYPTVTGGPVSISRAIRNLIDNANRYASLASITLEVDSENAFISIRDEGPGIDENLLDTIRKPFVRGETSRNTETGGNGLGLAITHEIVCSHGGKLHLANYDNKGLCATLVLPLSNKLST